MDDNQQTRRPIIVTLLVVIMFILSLANLAGVYAGWIQYTLPSILTSPAIAWLLIVMYGLWGITWAVMGFALLLRWDWARMGSIAAFILYQLTIIAQHELAVGGYERGRLPYLIVAAILLSGGWVYLLMRPAVKVFLDQEIPTESISAATDTR